MGTTDCTGKPAEISSVSLSFFSCFFLCGHTHTHTHTHAVFCNEGNSRARRRSRRKQKNLPLGLSSSCSSSTSTCGVSRGSVQTQAQAEGESMEEEDSAEDMWEDASEFLPGTAIEHFRSGCIVGLYSSSLGWPRPLIACSSTKLFWFVGRFHSIYKSVFYL